MKIPHRSDAAAEHGCPAVCHCLTDGSQDDSHMPTRVKQMNGVEEKEDA